MEIADAILINKSEGENRPRAELARQQYQNALHLLRPKSSNWTVPALLCSALYQEGIEEAWSAIEAFEHTMKESGEFYKKRQSQSNDWMWTLLMDDLKDLFMRDKNVAALLAQVQQGVSEGITTPGAAARRLLNAFRRGN